MCPLVSHAEVFPAACKHTSQCTTPQLDGIPVLQSCLHTSYIMSPMVEKCVCAGAYLPSYVCFLLHTSIQLSAPHMQECHQHQMWSALPCQGLWDTQYMLAQCYSTHQELSSTYLWGPIPFHSSRVWSGAMLLVFLWFLGPSFLIWTRIGLIPAVLESCFHSAYKESKTLIGGIQTFSDQSDKV